MTDYLHFVDLDERGEYRAHVEDTDGNDVFTHSADGEDLWLVDAGYMKNAADLDGLVKYLIEMAVLMTGDRVVSGYGYEPDEEDDEDDD